MPAWSPDGQKIVFAREYQDEAKAQQYEIWMMKADGSEVKQIKSLRGGRPTFLPDGRILRYSPFLE